MSTASSSVAADDAAAIRAILDRQTDAWNRHDMDAFVASRDFLLTALITSQALSCLTIPMAGHWSDLLGHKRLYLLGHSASCISC
jgi:hypothetical protein